MVYTSFRTYGACPFHLLSQKNGIHHSFFCSVSSGGRATDREKRGAMVMVYTLFLGVLSHHLKREMKSPHFVDFT